jgi:23S rRNA (adenine2503-C2)-methyltransferase
VRPALAISLHTTRPELRAELLPKAAPITPANWSNWASLRPRDRLPDPVPMDADRRHQRQRSEMDGIVRLLSGKYALMNLIPTTPRRRSITGGRLGK